MVNRLRTESTAETVTLGAVSFEAEHFSLKVQRKTQLQTLCDGTQRMTILGEQPCTLTLSGRTIPDDGSTLTGKLRALLSGDTAYAFDFRGCRFQSMRIIGLTCSTAQNHCEAELSLTLSGVLRGVTA